MKKPYTIRAAASLTLFFFLFGNFVSSPAFAFDVQVTEGDATVHKEGDITTINLNGQAVFEGDTSILANETVRMVGDFDALLRDMTGNRTEWLGQMIADGKIILVNTKGVFIAESANINVASLIASTLNIQNELFLTNQLSFEKMEGAAAAEILNKANLKAADGGYIIFLADRIENQGTITAYLGSVAFASGEKVSVSFDQRGLVNLVVDKGLEHELRDSEGNVVDQIINKGEINADGGKIQMTAKLLNTTLDRIVNNEGVVHAGRAVEHDGQIEFVADGGIDSMGSIVTNHLNEQGSSFNVGGVFNVEHSSIKNLDNAITYAANTDVSGSISDVANIVINAGVTLNMTGDTTFWADSDQNGSGAFLMDSTATITGNNHNLTLRASQNSTVGILDGIGTLTLDKSQSSSAPTFTSSTTVDDIDVTTFFTKNGATFSKTVGDGSSGTPYLIYDVSQLAGIANNLSVNYRLANNINASDFNFDPIGSSASKFTGSLDGNAKVISNLTINRSGEEYMGLFARVGTAGTVNDVRLTGVSITGAQYTGALTGYNEGTISNSYSTGTVNGAYHTGGLVGVNDGSLTDSYSTAEVHGGYFTGGLVGRNYDTIDDSHATGAVFGEDYTGGLIGRNEDASTVTDVYATGNVTGHAHTGGLIGENATGNALTEVYATGSVTGRNNVGGLIGTNYSTLTDVYAEGNVSTENDENSYSRIGGLVGFNSNGADIADSHATGTVNADESDDVGGLIGYNEGSDITNSYATGSVDGEDEVGGLIGYNRSAVTDSYATGSVNGEDNVGGLVGDHDLGTITNSYATGAVTGSGGDDSESIGGLVGYNSATISGSHATGTVTGDERVGGLVGRNTDDGTIQNSYSSGNVTIYGEDDSDYNFGGGLVGINNGTVTNSYYNVDSVTINGEHLVTYGGIYNAQYTDWVDGNYATLDPADYFTLNSGYYEIANLTDLKNFLGFSASSPALKFKITNDINLNNLNYNIPYLNVDELNGGGHSISSLALDMEDFVNVGFIAHNVSDVTDLHLTSGTANGGKNVGGLVGLNDGNITNSHTAVDVDGRYYVGGFVGDNDEGAITNSYSTGDVTANEGFAYGFVGHFYTDEDSITNSYYNIDSVLINDEHRAHSFGLYNAQYTDWMNGSRAALNIGNYFSTDGSGNYLIDDLTDLKNILPFVNTTSSATRKFLITGTIDLTSAPRFMIPVLKVLSFDGGSHALSNLTSHNEGYIYSGFIGQAIDTAISNLVLTNFSIKGGVWTGGMVGKASAPSSITNSSFQGSVQGGAYTAGLVGENSATISQSHIGASSSILGTGNYADTDYHDYYWGSDNDEDYVGGLIGYNNGVISDSYVDSNTSIESDESNVGGLIGASYNVNISNSYVKSGSTVQGYTSVGGLIGYRQGGTVTDSYSRANVTGTGDRTGGLIGYQYSGDISNSYATGTVSGGDYYVGGFVGYVFGGDISNSYSTGSVTNTDDYLYGWFYWLSSRGQHHRFLLNGKCYRCG